MTRGSQWQGVGIRHRGERQVLRTAQWNEVLRGELSTSANCLLLSGNLAANVQRKLAPLSAVVGVKGHRLRVAS